MKNDLLFLRHILDAIAAIEDYVKDTNWITFSANRMIRAAVVRELEIIGEAARNLSDELKSAHPDYRVAPDYRNEKQAYSRVLPGRY